MYARNAVANTGGRGGGRIHIRSDSMLVIEGRISADGANGGWKDGYYGYDPGGGGGSGGSILIEALNVTGGGIVRSNGGSPVKASAGGGSGGRVAFHLESTVSSMESAPSLSVSVEALGGWSSASSSSCGGGAAGTIFERHSNWTILRISNLANTAAEVITVLSVYELTHLLIYLLVCACICVSIYPSTYMCLCLSIFVCVCICICVDMRMYGMTHLT